MGPHAVHDLDRSERRFFMAQVRRGAVRSRVVKCLALAVCGCWSIGLLGLVDSSSSMLFHGALVIGGACLVACLAAAVCEASRAVKTSLLAIDRCGECGHKLSGSSRVTGRGFCSKTCTECGTHWTDLDRRESISTLYGCA